ncbi:MAG: hypothetical protein U0Q18_33335 [Bryobacteraceae bacterium]
MPPIISGHYAAALCGTTPVAAVVRSKVIESMSVNAFVAHGFSVQA